MGSILLYPKDGAFVEPLSAILRVPQKSARALPIPEYTTHMSRPQSGTYLLVFLQEKIFA